MYEIEVEDSLSLRLALHDPIKGLESTLPDPPDCIPYQHDGDATVLVGVVQQKEFSQIGDDNLSASRWYKGFSSVYISGISYSGMSLTGC